MDTKKLTNLAIEGNVDKIKEYRKELVSLINTKNLQSMRIRSVLERVKLVPGADEEVTRFTKEFEDCERIIKDAEDAISIIDKWAF